MKAWRGVPVLVSVLVGSLSGVGCGPAAEAGSDEVLASARSSVDAATGEADAAVKARRACGPEQVPGSKPEWLSRGAGRLFFSAEAEGLGRELWSSRGRAGCASVVKDVRPGVMGSVPRFLTPLDSWVLFVADDGEHGPELWRTDGTDAGTVMVKDVLPGERGSAPGSLTRVGKWVYFTARDFAHGLELWRTDGTEAGTRLVHEFSPGPGSLLLTSLTAWGDSLALVTYSDEAAVLWVVDSKGQARVLHQSAVGVLSSLTASGRRLFFLRDVGTDVAELWVTSERQGSATRVRDFTGEFPSSFVGMNGQVFFVAGADGVFGEQGDTRHGGELWRSDGTAVGTRVVRDIWPGPKGSLPSELVVMEGVLYFAAEDGWRGRELWRSDGTLLGTWMVWDLQWGEQGSEPEQLVAEDGSLFFSAKTALHGREAWTSDGWLWNTRRLTDIAPGTSSSDPHSFVRLGSEVFFLAGEALSDEALWVAPLNPFVPCLDGTSSDGWGC